MVKQKGILEQAAQIVDFRHKKQSKNVPKQAFLNRKRAKTSKICLFWYQKCLKSPKTDMFDLDVCLKIFALDELVFT